MANEQVGIDINLNAGNATQQIGSIRAQIKLATVALVEAQQQFGDYSKEALQAARRLAELKDRIAEANETAALFDPGKRFQAVTGTIQAMAGAFSAAQGAIGLMGVESQEVEKAILKVQSAMALSQGLSTIADARKDFERLGAIIKTSVITSLTSMRASATSAFATMRASAVTAFTTIRGALIATGIGAFAVGLGLIVANFGAIKEAVLRAVPGLANVGKIFGDLVTKVTDFVGITSEADRTLEKFTKTSERRKETLEGELKVLEASGASEKVLSDKRKEIINTEIKALEFKRTSKKKLSDEEEKKSRELTNELVVIDAKYNKSLTDANKKKNEEIAKANEQARKERDQARQAEFDKELGENEKRISRLIELQKKGLSEVDQKLFDLETQYKSDLQLFQGNEVAKANITKQYEEERFKIKRATVKKDEKAGEEEFKKFEKRVDKENAARLKLENMLNKTMTESIKKQKDDDLQITKLTEEQKLGIISGAVQTGIKLAGEGTVVGKALGIADATINTYVGASKALSTLPPPFSFIAAAATIAQGLMSVNSIINTKVPAGAGVSDSSGGASMPSAPAPIAPRGMEITPTTLDSRSLNTISNVVARAYVVESDITGSQQRIKRIENAARF
jgi:hypothetical protein